MIAVITLATFVAAGCTPVMRTSYKPVPLTEVKAGAQTFRFDMADGRRIEMVVDSVQYPFVRGWDERGRALTVDARQVKGVAVAYQEKDSAATTIKYFVVGTGIYAGVLTVVFVLVLITKSSCPFFYVDDGAGSSLLVGEAYSGAAFRSIARDDLLPTPLPAGTVLRGRLANEAQETQYTDRLELVVVDHSPKTRVLSTFDARLIAVGATRAPVAARDQDGRDVVALVRAADDQKIWETNLAESAARAQPALRESLDLAFSSDATADVPPGAPVLELTLSNTPWIDALMGRFFALMGNHLEGYIDNGNAPAAGSKIHGWRVREGLDLRVEAEVGGQFRTVAIVPTVGPMALRRVAVPLPTDLGAGPVRVRLSGGVGFWRVDQVALSRELPLLDSGANATVSRIAPSSARDRGGRDHREELRATDGLSQVLANRGESLALAFPLPPPAPGKQRTGFLLTHGYYNVHRPPQGDWSPLVLRDLRDTPGALAAFGIDLFRAYMRLTAANVPGTLGGGP